MDLHRRQKLEDPGMAWTMKQKIMAVMARREGDKPLSGRVEMDGACLGGVRSGGKRGRGAPGKTPFVAAVSTSPHGAGVRDSNTHARAGDGAAGRHRYCSTES